MSIAATLHDIMHAGWHRLYGGLTFFEVVCNIFCASCFNERMDMITGIRYTTAANAFDYSFHYTLIF